MNKYNIRAIRNDLESCIRYNSWKRFRNLFHSLDSELQKAVVLNQSAGTKQNSNKQSASSSLVYTLCRCIKPSSYPPIDVFEAVLKASTHAITTTTPLSIAIDRQASIDVIEVLLRYDLAKESSLYQKGKCGDTPILAAIRQRRQCQHQSSSSSSEEVVRLLLSHDRTKQSLLIASKAKQRVPLYYVANEEIPFLLSSSEDDDEVGDDDLDIDEGFEYLLLQTYQAIEIQQKRRMPPELEDEVAQTTPKRALFLLYATIACAHLLGSKNNVKLLLYLLKLIERKQIDLFQSIDDHSDSLLHHCCRAQESSAFLEPAVLVGENKLSILQYLMESCPSNNALILQNQNGEIPLHTAIQANKSWDFLRHICNKGTLCAKTKRNQLALHLAIERYPANSNEILSIWNGYPEATIVMDEKTKLFAFQLAAVAANERPRSCKSHDNDQVNTSSKSSKRAKAERVLKRKGDASNAKNTADLQLVFFLLRAYPQVLQANSLSL